MSNELDFEALEAMTPAEREVVEKDMLRQRLKDMGVTYSNNAGVDALRTKLRDALEGKDSTDNAGDEDEVPPAPLPGITPDPESAPLPETPKRPLSKAEQRNQIRLEQTRLIRCRITNMDPKKRDWPGQFLTVANEYIGSITRYIPFGEVTDNGWHIEYALYTMMKDMQFLDIKTKKVKGQNTQETKRMSREYAIEILPDLTPAELKKLANAQLAAGTSTLTPESED